MKMNKNAAKVKKQIVKILGYSVTVGSKKHALLVWQQKHFNDLANKMELSYWLGGITLLLARRVSAEPVSSSDWLCLAIQFQNPLSTAESGGVGGRCGAFNDNKTNKPTN